MTIYYLIYIILFVLSLIEISGGRVYKAYKKIMLVSFFLLFIFLSTIYYGPVGDVYKYEWYFNVVKFNHLVNPIEPFEKGYILINILLRLLTDRYWVLRFVQAVIVIGTWKLIILSKHSNFLYEKEFLAIFCLWSLKNGNIFITRSSIAVVICIYSIRFIQEKCIIKFMITIIAACTFHVLAVVFIPAYWLYHINHVRCKVYLMIILAGLLSAFLPTILNWTASIIPVEYLRIKIIHYINDIGLVSYTMYSYTYIFIKALLNMGISIAFFEIASYLEKKSFKQFEGYLNLYSFGVLIYFIAIHVSTGMTRAALPYMDMQIILLPQLFEIPFVKRNIKNRFLVFLMFSVYLFLRMYVNIQDQPYTTMF